MRRLLRRGLSSRLVIGASGFAAFMLIGGSVAGAHEIGTTRVSVVLRDRSYQIDIVTDATALLEKLEASTGRPPCSDQGCSPQALLAATDHIFRRRLKVAFDGSDVSSTTAYFVSPQTDATAPGVATVRLSGEIPRGARAFTWTYSWTFASYALTVRTNGSETPVTEWLEGGQTSTPFVLSEAATRSGRLGIAWRYFTLGFTHIVPYGLDHVLFVLGIFLLSGRARSVLWQVSAFTVGHSITLALSMYDLIAVSPSVVEPLIALSIAYVAFENIVLSELRSWRIALVLAFGLLHGMGFAGVLKELGLPHSDFLMALLTFNGGVEAGQLAVIGAAFLLVGLPCRTCTWYRQRIVVPASALIACIALYWTVERLSF